MPIPYFVRQKKNFLNKAKSGLWYAVIRKIQKRSEVNEKKIGEMVAMRSGFSRGVVKGGNARWSESLKSLFYGKQEYVVKIEKREVYPHALKPVFT